MLHRNIFILFCFSLLFGSPSFARVIPVMIAVNDSVTESVSQEETILFNMINDMRMKNKLPAIPLSVNLCKVAHTHIDDLIVSKPQEKGCSLHSWSESGKWTACCNSKDPAGIQCMKSKPREITGYPGNGFELIYWGDDNATPADAAELWQQVSASSDMILSRGKWKGYQWKAMGLGIEEGYAILWLGDKTDKIASEKPVKPAIAAKKPVGQNQSATSGIKESEKVDSIPVEQKKEAKKVVPEAARQPGETGSKYYLVVASVKTPESAKSELKRFKSKGYSEAFILEGASVYRIAIKSYDSEKQARAKLNDLQSDLPGIWVFKK